MLKIITTIGGIQVLAITITIVRSKIMAVLLGPEGIGVISIIDQVVQFVGYVCVFSLPLASLKFLSKSHSEGFEAFRKSYSSFLKILFILAAIGTVATIGLVNADLLGSEITRYKAYVILALLAIPTNVLGGFFSHVLAAAQNTTASAMIAVVTGALLTISTYIGISLAKIQGMYLGNVMAGILVTIIIVIYLKRKLDLPFYDKNIRMFDTFRQNPGIIPFSFMLYLATITYSLSFLVARYYVLKNFGEAEAGLLQAVIAMGMSIGMVLGPTNGLFLTPILNRNIAKNEKIRTAAEFQKKLTIILSMVAMPFVLFPQLLLTMLYSPSFAVAGQYVFLFVISQCILQIVGIYYALLIGFDDLKIYALLACTGNLSVSLLSWFLAPHYGILGVAISFIVSGLIVFFMTLTTLRLRHGFSIPGNVYSLMGYSLLVMTIVGVIFNKQKDLHISIVMVKFLIYISFVVSLVFFLSKGERSSLYNLWNRVKLNTNN